MRCCQFCLLLVWRLLPSGKAEAVARAAGEDQAPATLADHLQEQEWATPHRDQMDDPTTVGQMLPTDQMEDQMPAWIGHALRATTFIAAIRICAITRVSQTLCIRTPTISAPDIKLRSQQIPISRLVTTSQPPGWPKIWVRVSPTSPGMPFSPALPRAKAWAALFMIWV